MKIITRITAFKTTCIKFLIFLRDFFLNFINHFLDLTLDVTLHVCDSITLPSSVEVFVASVT